MCETSEIASLRKYIFKGKDLLYFIKKNHSFRKKEGRFDIQGNRALALQISEFPFPLRRSKEHIKDVE